MVSYPGNPDSLDGGPSHLSREGCRLEQAADYKAEITVVHSPSATERNQALIGWVAGIRQRRV